ncbi:MAG: phosphoserine phosphatase SerB [Parvibaculales bacterium]
MSDRFFLVLTADPAQANLTPTIGSEILTELGVESDLTCLAQNIAYETEIDPITANQLNAEKSAKLCRTYQTDINIISAAHRRKKLLVADMESTIIEQECLDELAELLDLRPQIADITERAMRGEIDFEPALRERVMLLKGLNESTLEDIYRDKVTLMPGAEQLIATMNAHGAICALVSGGFSFYAEKIAQRLGFDRWESNHLSIQNGALDGTVQDPILGRDAKAQFLSQWQQQENIPQAAIMAVGDGSNDLAMLAIAGAGVAFRAKPLVAEAAKIAINYGDLTALLYLQGYHQQDFVNKLDS